MSIDIGTTVTHGSDKYEVKDLLSSGGFGTAFLAERQSPGVSPIMVVVKVPATHVLAHPIWSQKFAREARILANINHPNVVKIIAFWEFPDGEKALVQELVTGASELPGYLNANVDSTASLLLQTFYALHAFHSMTSPSAVHRDLSPRNILVSDTGIVKVIDFGLAKEDPRATRTLTLAGDLFGTPGCMSPEQITDAASVDHRADLYAVGRSFAAALQGRHPQIARPEKLPEPWRTICMRLTEDDAADRPQSAFEALSEAMIHISTARLSIENYPLHVKEMSNHPIMQGWAEICEMQLLGMLDYNQSDVRTMWLLQPDVFKPPFNVNTLFDQIETSSAIRGFILGNVAFDDADPLGELYVRLYPYLDITRKLLCFSRVCNTAVRLYRYSVMHDIRSIYRVEPDPIVHTQLMAILKLRTQAKSSKAEVFFRGFLETPQHDDCRSCSCFDGARIYVQMSLIVIHGAAIIFLISKTTHAALRIYAGIAGVPTAICDLNTLSERNNRGQACDFSQSADSVFSEMPHQDRKIASRTPVIHSPMGRVPFPRSH